MTFTKLQLSGNRVLIKGTDSQGTGPRETVVDGTEWTEVNRRKQSAKAGDEFDAVVEEFFRPLVEAAEKLDKASDEGPRDSNAFVILEEGSEGTPAIQEKVVHLSKDSQILRLLDEGHDNRLIWVGDELEILDVLPGTNVPVVGNGDPHGAGSPESAGEFIG